MKSTLHAILTHSRLTLKLSASMGQALARIASGAVVGAASLCGGLLMVGFGPAGVIAGQFRSHLLDHLTYNTVHRYFGTDDTINHWERYSWFSICHLSKYRRWRGSSTPGLSWSRCWRCCRRCIGRMWWRSVTARTTAAVAATTTTTIRRQHLKREHPTACIVHAMRTSMIRVNTQMFIWSSVLRVCRVLKCMGVSGYVVSYSI